MAEMLQQASNNLKTVKPENRPTVGILKNKTGTPIDVSTKSLDRR